MSLSRSGSYSENSSTRSTPGYLYSKPDGPKKIIDLINQKVAEGKQWFSFEYFPPKTEAGITNLYSRIESMSLMDPLFLDITWGAGGSTADLTLDLATTMQSNFGPEVMMHLTCTNMSRESILTALRTAKAHGVRNILALRGDPPHGQEKWEQHNEGYSYAIDLVKLIRSEFGDWFGVGVAGYPECHTDSLNADDDMRYLKEKCDAGADFIVTQLFYDCDLFLDWVKRCRAAGINIPILPGIMPIQSYAGFKRMTGFCKTYVPQYILDALEPIKNDDAAVRKYGVKLGADMCRTLFENGIQGVHLYTLNLTQSCAQILNELDLVVDNTTLPRRSMPWRQSQATQRNKTEHVRPIFWSNRVDSYLARSREFDFPNGRFGSSQSAAYGELSNYFMCPPRNGTPVERRKLWGEELHNENDVADAFVKFVQGDIPRLPWCETSLSLESQDLIETLVKLNRKGFFTINSQPAINGVPSDHPVFGWGPKDGYVYQKAYLEFFVSPQNFEKFVALARQYPSLTYSAMNAQGQKFCNVQCNEQDDGSQDQHHVNAVTWGVFPNSQILQPTIVDSQSFAVWKDEAFTLFLTVWQSIYEQGTTSYNLLQEMHDNYILVNVVDNDYIRGDLFKIFEKLE